jgi:Fe/S biogenesis protein NfuA
MITITEVAKEKILANKASDEVSEDFVLRLAITGYGPGGFRYALGFAPQDQIPEDDKLVEDGDLQVYVDAASAPKLEGATLKYVEDTFQRGFAIDNPNPLWDDPVAQAVQEVLDKQINPGVASHSGYVTLLEVKDDTAFIQFGGGCQGCGMVDVTLKQGVTASIKEAVPQIKKVLDTTDHEAGTNPYYTPSQRGASPVA